MTLRLLRRASAALPREGTVICSSLEAYIGIIFLAGKLSLIGCMFQKSKRCQSLEMKSLLRDSAVLKTQMRILKCT